MENSVFLAILLAALLHATWNSVVKVGGDRASTVLLLSLVQGGIGLVLLPFVPVPAAAAWPWIAAGAALHLGYKLFLIEAYAHADLSQAYPLARGAAPLIVTLFSVAALGVRFDGMALAAIAAISAGLLLMAMKGSASGWMRGRALFFALGTAGFTAGYTLVDGMGARLSGTAAGFILWLVAVDALLMALVAVSRRGTAVFSSMRAVLPAGIAAGAMSLASYWIAIWAFTQAPLAMVAALRESSILFAVLIAGLVLREPVGRWRWTSAALIACGVALMKA